jgi:hypothetical protein
MSPAISTRGSRLGLRGDDHSKDQTGAREQGSKGESLFSILKDAIAKPGSVIGTKSGSLSPLLLFDRLVNGAAIRWSVNDVGTDLKRGLRFAVRD